MEDDQEDEDDWDAFQSFLFQLMQLVLFRKKAESAAENQIWSFKPSYFKSVNNESDMSNAEIQEVISMTT
uniref:Uncharacterized protein n=1 Tax=Salix viminalis TaxID=40686 RepID=A0A6N2N838_SALVM